jgi:8-oxo-dGTP pyrophosphatase MutT (NUDIX family)
MNRRQHPAVTSYGIILYKIIDDKPNILMINRKDSLCYIDFLRGKYNPYNINYIQILINKFSIFEKEKILNKSFETLWSELWLIDNEEKIKFNNDYYRGENKFNIIKKGFIKDGTEINLETLIKKSKTKYGSPEWEFPKGRKFKAESNKKCAIREFTEETGITEKQYRLFSNLKPFIENYIGENKVKYIHVYYIGILLDDLIPEIDKNNRDQCLEISDIRLFNRKDSLNIIRDYHRSREKIINNIFEFINNLNNKIYEII